MIEETPCLTFQLTGNLRQVDGRWLIAIDGGGWVSVPFMPNIISKVNQVVACPFNVEGEAVDIRVMFPGRTGENTELRRSR